MDSDFRPVKRPKSLQTASSQQTAETKTTPPSESFRTPDEVAADESSTSDIAGKIDLSTTDSSHTKANNKWRDKLKFSWPPGKREWLASLIIILFCGTATAFIISHTQPKPVVSATKIVKAKPKAAPKPTTVASTLTGLQVDPSVNTKPVTGVMIENSLDARPQSGLSDAGVVFEAIAEGGITRFLALFQDTAPADVGPIRSARPYYVQWALGFDAGYAHVGGSPEALADIKAWGARDLDQFYNGASYHRISSRAAPHNVYTSIDTLNQLEASKGYVSSSYTGFVRKKPDPSKQPTAKSINIFISGPLYNTHYDYNPATNTYNRSEGGSPHLDANGSKQISPNVVIAIVVPYSLESDGYHSAYQALGSGQAFIFQDGTVTTGTWSKPDAKTQLSFSDSAGKPLGLNPGQTWITAVSTASNVSYNP